MKKKSLLFLSVCAWALQSHLVQADTLTETTKPVSQGQETTAASTIASTTSNVPATSVVEVSEQSDSTTNQGSVADVTLAETDSQTSPKEASPVLNQSASTTSTNTVSATSAKAEISFAPSQTETRSVPNEPTGTVSVVNVDVQKGSYDVKVTNVSAPKEISNVYVPTWIETSGQDDIIWYEAQRQLDGSYLLNVNKAQHKYGSGKYHSHVYYRMTDGSLTGIGAASVILPEIKASGTIKTTNINAKT
ncbi:TPA: GBS Bsp-like repeat-containing protein, partial [Streptococcus suis]